jgi:hypothetical protein
MNVTTEAGRAHLEDWFDTVKDAWGSGSVNREGMEATIAKIEAQARQTLSAAVRRLYAADHKVHSAYDGECGHGFGPPATLCPNADCPERELAEAWAALL